MSRPFVPSCWASPAALAFPATDARRWLTDDERWVYEGALAPDIEIEIEIGVKLDEHKGKKRPSTKRTPEQEIRECAASENIPAVRRACSRQTTVTILTRLANERRAHAEAEEGAAAGLAAVARVLGWGGEPDVPLLVAEVRKLRGEAEGKASEAPSA